VKIVRVVPLPHARSEVWSYFGFIADDTGEIHDKRKTICKICATTLSYSGNTTNLFTHLKAMHPEVTPQKINPSLRTPRPTPIKTTRKRKHADDSETSQCITILPIESPKNNANLYTNNSNRSQVQCTTAPAYESEVDVVAHKSNGNDSTGSMAHHSSSHAATSMSKFKSHEESQSVSAARDEEITNALANFIAKDCRPLGIVSGRGFEDFLRTMVPGYKIPDMAKLEPLVRKKYHDIRYNLFMRSIDTDSDILM
jgi:hypothetical protein